MVEVQCVVGPLVPRSYETFRHLVNFVGCVVKDLLNLLGAGLSVLVDSVFIDDLVIATINQSRCSLPGTLTVS
jgi:hypothetical protein